jgi:formylmethanofuran dehydrogenase subunit E
MAGNAIIKVSIAFVMGFSIDHASRRIADEVCCDKCGEYTMINSKNEK